MPFAAELLLVGAAELLLLIAAELLMRIGIARLLRAAARLLVAAARLLLAAARLLLGWRLWLLLLLLEMSTQLEDGQEECPPHTSCDMSS